ncbi:MAG: universal stress protein [Burkholderiales bacterium]|nr:universal stress protein [Burkholderiales bacterium]
MRKVVVALDGSDHSKYALQAALKLFDTDSMHIHLLTVCEPIHVNEVLFKDTLTDMRQLEEEHMAANRKIVETAATELKGAGISHDTHVEIGQPAQTIVGFSKKYHCEMIVMGTRGLGAIQSIALGSVANKVVHLAGIAVLLAK